MKNQNRPSRQTYCHIMCALECFKQRCGLGGRERHLHRSPGRDRRRRKLRCCCCCLSRSMQPQPRDCCLPLQCTPAAGGPAHITQISQYQISNLHPLEHTFQSRIPERGLCHAIYQLALLAHACMWMQTFHCAVTLEGRHLQGRSFHW